ncbi:hypothetical protein ACOSP7_003476 [Xanthoceras sorbifolium]
MACCAQGIDVYYSPPIAKALAIRRGLLLAIETGFSRVCIESDVTAVVNLVINRSPILSEIDIVITDIILLFNSLKIIFILYMARKANHIAYRLAKFGLLFIEDFVWLEDCPLYVENLVLNDC